MTDQELKALKEQLRQLVIDDVGAAIQALKKALPDGGPKEDTVLALEGRLNDVNRNRLRGVISNEELQRAYNRLRTDLIDLITGLEAADFKLPKEGPVIPKRKTGHILYQIPRKMQLQAETKCVIRLAYEEESIIRNIELTEDTSLKSLRISQVMNVALVDPNQQETFQIRSLSAEEQFVERGDYTEWIFYVRPLAEGTFPLVLRVSVIELILGKERRKDIVLEESVQITTAVPEPVASEFEAAPYALTAGGSPLTGSEIPGDDMLAPSLDRGVPPEPQAPPAAEKKTSASSRSRTSYLRPLSIAASVLILVIAGTTLFLPSNRETTESATEGRDEEMITERPGVDVGEPLSPSPAYYEVRLLLSDSLQQARIKVDDEWTEPLEVMGDIRLLQLERRRGPYHFELYSESALICRDSVKIDRDGQLIELDCRPVQ